MKRRLVELLCCPVCKGSLKLTVLSEADRPVAIAPPSSPACGEKCELRDTRIGKGLTEPDVDECTACYGREIDEGLLYCRACGLLYPVIESVPRLVRNAEHEYWFFCDRHRDTIRALAGREPAEHNKPQDSSIFDPRSNESFGLQWTNQNEGEKTWFKDDGSLRKGEFLYSLGVTPEELHGALILDAGCGNGRLIASVATFGAEVVGMDLSRGIDRAQAGKSRYAGEHEHFVHFVQGNVMEPPFRAGSFDIIHSSGVLHHTPSTARAFTNVLPAARSGGRVYVQLYRRRELWVGIPNALLRKFTSRLPPRMLYRLCQAAVPLHTKLVQLVARLRGEESPIASASVGERALSLFDNFSPRYQYRYKPEQVRQMFETAGLIEIEDTTLENEARHMVAFTARKPMA